MRASGLILTLLVGCTLYDRGLVPEDATVRDGETRDVPGVDGAPADAPLLDVPFVDGGPEAGAVCPMPTGDCDPFIDGCETNLSSNGDHCGRCGNRCGTDSLCTLGICTCVAGREDCNGGADGCETDVTDEETCGGCNIACGPNAGCAPALPTYLCECDPGWGDCNGDLGNFGGNGCETQLNTDDACGTCERMCLPGQMCELLGDPPAPTCDGCGLRHPPNRMLGTSGPDGGSLVFALRDPIVDQADPVWETIAFDVDDHCTDDTGVGTAICENSVGAVIGDGASGTDNSLGRSILSAASGVISPGRCPLDPADETCTFPERVSQLMESGINTQLVVLSEWDGDANDDQVRVAVFQVADFSRTDGETLPQWDGNDTFHPSTSSYDAAMNPLVFDDFAYVTDNTLVMRIPSGPAIEIPWPGGNPLGIYLTDANLVADIQLTPVVRLLNVRIGGRYPVSRLATNLSQAGVCEPPLVIPAVVAMSNQFADVMESTTLDIPEDKATLSRSCNAISGWLGFTGYPAIFGTRTDPPPLLTSGDCD